MKRRSFLKYIGIGAAAATVASCIKSADNDSPAAKHKKGPMTMRTNHNTGDRVSLLGYGCMRLPVIKGEDETIDYIDQDEVNNLTDYALKNGVNYFDTAPVYCKGRSEHAMGIALSRHPRNSYFLATKMSNFSPDTWPREKSIAIFENSLKELQTDYVDYLLLHAIGGSSDEYSSMQTFKARFIDNGILQYLQDQKKAGKIRNLGFSYHGDIAIFNHLLKEMDEGRAHWDFVQIQHNYVDWNHAKDVNESNTNSEYLYNELAKRNIPIVIMEPLLGGRLANVPASVAAKMKKRRPNDSVASWAFRYAGTLPQILTVLSGMTYMEHLQENINTYSSLDEITPSENEFLQEVAMEIILNNNVPCTGCSYCMPCPFGIDIPTIFAHYNKCINDDNVPRDTRNPRYAEARRAFLVGYDRKVPRLRQAAHCIGCGTCTMHCPQSIDIPAEMHNIDIYTQKLRAHKA
jgi:hypothetical protein